MTAAKNEPERLDAPNQQVVRGDGSGPADEGDGGAAPAPPAEHKPAKDEPAKSRERKAKDEPAEVDTEDA